MQQSTLEYLKLKMCRKNEFHFNLRTHLIYLILSESYLLKYEVSKHEEIF